MEGDTVPLVPVKVSGYAIPGAVLPGGEGVTMGRRLILRCRPG
jgi:hypothetical protein